MPESKQSEVGDFREYAGITFAAVEYLKTFDGRLRGVVWRPAPVGIGSRVDESWHHTTGHRFAANGVHCRTFEAAAIRSLKGEAARARKARDFLAQYDAPELAAARRLVEKLG